MNKQTIIKTMEQMIANGYAETEIGYHAEYRLFGDNWRRGCYAQIAAPYGGTTRVYAPSYAELYEALISDGYSPINGVAVVIELYYWNHHQADIDRACDALGDIPHYVADRAIFKIAVGAADLREAVRRLNAAGFDTDEDIAE